MKTYPCLLVIAFVLFIISSGCKKSGTGPAASQYTAGMAGMKIWHGTKDYEGYVYTNNPDSIPWVVTIDTFSNDSSAITIVNSATIVVFSDTLPFTGSGGNSITFSTSGSDNSGGIVSSWSNSLIYYYLADSLVYEYSSSTGTQSNTQHTETVTCFTP